MATTSGATRWWEGYLVRYFMPSIAGIAIILWLSTIAGDDFRSLLFLPQDVKDLNSQNLILLILYANLYCYVASYPILGFHVTRVIDFKNDRWPNKWWLDGYILSLILGALSFFVSIKAGSAVSFFLAFASVGIFILFQIFRIVYGLRVRRKYQGLEEDASPIFAFAYSLAKRRSVIEEIEEKTSQSGNSNYGEESLTGKIRTSRWRPEFIDTYRHMREHGNSAFIFFLELCLAGFVYAILAYPCKSAFFQLSAIGLLFALWAVPAVLVHLLGQDLERRFSQYGRRLEK